MTHRWKIKALSVAVVACATGVLVARLAMGGEAAAPRALIVNAASSDVALFDSASPVRAKEEAVPAVVFDKAALPEDYETCYRENVLCAHLKITNPYEGSSFPRNIAAPEFRWEDRTDNLWMVSLTAPGWNEPVRVVTNGRGWRPDAALWERVKSSGAGGNVTLEVRGIRAEGTARAGDTVYADSISFHVSEYDADPMIIYRMVTPLFHAFKTPDIWWRDITSFNKGLFYPGDGVYCTNCHAFPGSPDLKREDLEVAIAVRKQLGKPTYRILGLYNFASRVGRTLGINSFFMSWDPLGTKMIACKGVEIYSKPLVTLEAQEFFVRHADIVVVDAKTLKEEPLPGASTAEYMETFPAWSPDGKTILFARAEEMGDEWHETKFNLYRLAYNDGKGGTPEPVSDACDNGLSNFFPRFSPDGKWIVFNKADWSSLVAPTADLYIMSTQPGSRPRKLECNVDYAMDSWHSWSSNSRWLLFATKRRDGIFATVMMTEIDENGHASPPIELPTKDGNTMMCYNVPEFMKYSFPIDSKDIVAKTGWLDEEKR